MCGTSQNRKSGQLSQAVGSWIYEAEYWRQSEQHLRGCFNDIKALRDICYHLWLLVDRVCINVRKHPPLSH
jgi:hypothetical protein